MFLGIMIWLQITSFLFSTITIHAYFKSATDIFIYSLFLSLFSLWYFCTYNMVIKWLHYFVCIYYFVYTTLTLFCLQSPLLLTLIIFAFTLYNMETAYSPQLKLKWNIILHFHIIMCSHFYLS